MVSVTFVQPDGTRVEVDAAPGDSVMETAKANLVPGIVGDCGGGLSCATCHVFVDEPWRDVLEPPTPAEEDMLETTAVEATDRSRLGCQIVVGEAIEGLVLHVPEKQE